MSQPSDPSREYLERKLAQQRNNRSKANLVFVAHAVIAVLYFYIWIRYEEPIIFFSYILLVLASTRAGRYGNEMSAPLAQELLSADERAPVLYFRPFEVDGGIVSSMYEKRIADSLIDLGPVVAVGQPDEEFPASPFIFREYFLGGDWQRGVLDLMDRAVLLIIHVGVSKGISWEIEQVVLQGHPERLVICFGPDAPTMSIDRRTGVDDRYRRQFVLFEKPDTTEQRYYKFLESFNHLFPRGLASECRNGKFVAFRSDWAPILSDELSVLGEVDYPFARHLQSLHRALEK